MIEINNQSMQWSSLFPIVKYPTNGIKGAKS